jgi:hypothetical protein
MIATSRKTLRYRETTGLSLYVSVAGCLIAEWENLSAKAISEARQRVYDHDRDESTLPQLRP